MKTRIYKSHQHFLKRVDKSVNGVSPEFAEQHPNYQQDNDTNHGCWNCYRCRACSDCRNCIDCHDCHRCHRCHNCRVCRNCIDCHDCHRCHRCHVCSACHDCHRCRDCHVCSACHDCHDCRNCHVCSACHDCIDCSACHDCRNCIYKQNVKNNTQQLSVPTIDNIHQQVLSAVTQDGNELYMGSWHQCDTTHCRAGWVVHLAGDAGYKLEAETNTAFAAMQIYRQSSPDIYVSPNRFYDSDDVAMTDIVRCAQLEKTQ